MTLGLENVAKREITKELLSTKKHYELILGNMREGILEMTQDTRIVYANRAATRLMGVREEKLLGSVFLSFFADKSRARIKKSMTSKAVASGRGSDEQLTAIGRRQVAVTLLPVPAELSPSFIVILNDVTERLRAQRQLQEAHDDLERRVAERTAELSKLNKALAGEVTERRRADERMSSSLREKELLLRELHHRVKNNLQTISSLLKLRLRRSSSSELSEIVRDTQNRIRSIWLVHERLYRSENLSMVDFSEYVRTLAQHLFDSHSVDREAINLLVECDPIELNIDMAIPCGLILNELVSNCLRHAFPNGRSGEVAVRLRRAEKSVRLEVQDNGVGIPENAEKGNSGSLGITLVYELASQIDGTVQVDRTEGTHFVVRFPTQTGEKVDNPSA
jgi:PAS domain S-box-containing protein